MASKRAVRRRQCGDKVALAGKPSAMKAASTASRIEREYIHAYRCPFCRKWHIGHPPKPKRWNQY